jgi:hypothetical protein
MTCVDLSKQFPRYRLSWEANGATKGQWKREEGEWPWLMELRGRYGTVSPYGGEILQAMTDRPRIGAQLRALPCVLSARGADEIVVRFHVDHAPAVFNLLRPYRRRQLSEADRAKKAEILARARDRDRRDGLLPLSGEAFPALGSTIGAGDEAGAI